MGDITAKTPYHRYPSTMGDMAAKALYYLYYAIPSGLVTGGLASINYAKKIVI